MDFVIHFGDTIAAFSQQHSEWLLPLFFVLIFCETGLVLTPFLPGSTLLLIAGGFAARGDFALYEIVGLLAVAATLGDSMGFFFGRLLGLNSRFIKPAYLAKANAFQTRFGAKAYALARFVPIARGLVPFIAGANGVPYRVFLPPNATGVVLCVTSFCAAGYFSAELQQVPPLAWGWAQESLSGAACAGVRSRRFRTMHRTAQRPLSHQGQNMNTRTSPDRNAPLRWSIVSTLAVLYTIATLAVLALAGSYLYLALESELLLRDTATVSHQVRRLRQGVGEAKAGDTPERWSRRWAEHAEGDPRFQSRVLDASNNVVAMTAGMAQLQAAFPPPTGLDALPAAGWRWKDASKNKFLLVAAQASSADGKPYRLQVAMDLTDSKEVLDGYRVKVGIMLLLGGLCAGLIGYFVARRSMQPLAALAQAIETEGDGRSGAKGYRWPAEFGAVLDAIERRSARRQIDGGS